MPTPGAEPPLLRATTILAVRHRGRVALACDGQVTFGQTVLKHGAVKLRRMYQDRVLAGFAGAAADAMTLFERFEGRLEAHEGDVRRAAVELVKAWRTERMLQRLEAQLVVCDARSLLLLSGAGDVLEPDLPVLGIGSGGPFAQAAAEALIAHTDMDAARIVEAAMQIAARLCIYTNDRLSIETLEAADDTG